MLLGAIDLMRFAKVESIGNDFVLIESGEDYAALAIRLCSRHFGVGSDGLLVVSPLDGGVDMRMFNPDGTEDFCGNGLRCAAVYAVERGWVGERFQILHGGRQVETHVRGRDVSTVIGPASFTPERVPLAGGAELFRDVLMVSGKEVQLSSLTTGSTHTIIEVHELPDHERFRRISQSLEHHEHFPERTSVIWVRADDSQNLFIRIWERGVGETLGCGTGSSAAAVVHARGLGRGGTFSVHNPGGTVQVSLTSWSDEITVSGAARIVYEGVTTE
jgi:diaminopimelate epimerase